MRDLVIMPAMAQRRESLNMGEFAEEAVTVEEVAAALNLFHAYNPSKDLHLLRTLGQMSISTSEDSTPLRVCRNQRILIHKTFEGLAERGKCSMGWSFGFKLHLIINDKGEILNFMFTPGNVDDREPLKQGKFLENIKGKLCADKGYIGQALFENLFLNGIQLVTKVKNNMKNSLMSIADKILLRKRALIETGNDELKNIAQIEHSRHRSFNNFIANSLSAIAAYCFFEKKPAIDVNFVNDGQLSIF